MAAYHAPNKLGHPPPRGGGDSDWMVTAQHRLSPFRTYREFVAGQRDDLDPATFSKRYAEYRVSYGHELVRRFFERNADYEWFRERYDPSCLRARIAEQRERAAAEASAICSEIQAEGLAKWATRASLDPIRDNAAATDETKRESTVIFDDSAQRVSDHESSTIVMGSGVPPSCSKRSLEAAIAATLEDRGVADTKLTRIVLTDERNRRENFETEAWIFFESKEAASAAEEALQREPWLELNVPPALAMAPLPWPLPEAETEGRVLERGSKMRTSECTEKESFRLLRPRRVLFFASSAGVDDFGRGARPRRFPRAFGSPRLSEPARLAKDAEVASDLADALDTLAQIEDELRLKTILATAAELDVARRFDVCAAYLRRVHLLLYYSATQCNSELELLTREVPWYTRRDKALHDDDQQQGGAAASTAELLASARQDDEDWGPQLKEMDDKLRDLLNAALMTVAETSSGTQDANEEHEHQQEEDIVSKVHDKIAYVEPRALKAAADEEDSKLDMTLETFMSSHTAQEEQGRARCAFDWCRKLFKSDNFLRKHLANRHADYLEAWLTPTRRTYMWSLYAADTRKPLPPISTEKGDEIEPVDLIDQQQRLRPEPPHHRSKRSRPRSRSDPDQPQTKRNRHAEAGGPADPRKLASYADVDAPKRPVLSLDYGVLLPPPSKKKRSKSTGKSAPTSAESNIKDEPQPATTAPN